MPWHKRPQGSAGRDPHTSPQARSQHLASLPEIRPPVSRDDGVPDDIAALEDADQLVAATEHDLDEAQKRLFYTRAGAPQMAESRSLSPGDRHWVQVQQAEEAHQRALEAYTRATSRRDALVAQWDASYETHRFEPLNIDGEVGLSPRDRSRRS